MLRFLSCIGSTCWCWHSLLDLDSPIHMFLERLVDHGPKRKSRSSRQNCSVSSTGEERGKHLRNCTVRVTWMAVIQGSPKLPSSFVLDFTIVWGNKWLAPTLKKYICSIFDRYTDGSGGCDGCLNWHGVGTRFTEPHHWKYPNVGKTDNNGLRFTVEVLEGVYTDPCFPDVTIFTRYILSYHRSEIITA